MSTRRTLLKGIFFGLLLSAVSSIIHLLLIQISNTIALLGVDLIIEILIFIGVGIYFYRLLERRKFTEDELRKLSRAVEQSPISVVITDLEGRIEYVNPKFTTLTGYTLDEVHGKNPRILKSGHTPLEEYQQMWQAISAGNEWRGEMLNVKKNGELYWELAKMSAVRNGTGKITHYLAIKEDITERRRIQTAEREQRALAEALRDTAEIFSRTLGLDEVLRHLLLNAHRVSDHKTAYVMLIEDATARMAHCSGYTPEQTDVMMTVHFPVSECPGLLSLIENQKIVLVRGAEVQANWCAIPILTACHAAIPICLDGTVVGFMGLNYPDDQIPLPNGMKYLETLAKQAAIALQNTKLYETLRRYGQDREQEVIERTSQLEYERAMLRTIIDGIAEGVLYREQGHYIFANRALARMVGGSPENIQDGLDIDIYSKFIASPADAQRIQAEVDATLSTHPVWRGEARVRRIDGSEFDAALSIANVHSPTQAVIGRVTLVRDVSQEKELQNQKNRFLAHAAHELRTPMSNIKMRLYLLRKQPDKQEQHLDVLAQVTDSMAHLIEDLLDIFRFQGSTIELHQQMMPLQSVIHEALAIQKTQAESHGITLHADLPTTPIHLCGDRHRLTQALSNLIGHAVNRTSDQGDVWLQTSMEDHKAVICLSYTGSDAENTPDVFEPFYHASEGSDIHLGLGLTIAKEIIALHEGQILVGSLTQDTSGFRILLPLGDCP